MAKQMFNRDKTLVPGSHPTQQDKVAVVHYAASAGHQDGFSLEDWGPVRVDSDPDARKMMSGIRAGAPVFTVEVYNYDESGAFEDGAQLVNEDCQALDLKDSKLVALVRSRVNQKRCKQLQAYAEVLMKIFLEK